MITFSLLRREQPLTTLLAVVANALTANFLLSFASCTVVNKTCVNQIRC